MHLDLHAYIPMPIYPCFETSRHTNIQISFQAPRYIYILTSIDPYLHNLMTSTSRFTTDTVAPVRSTYRYDVLKIGPWQILRLWKLPPWFETLNNLLKLPIQYVTLSLLPFARQWPFNTVKHWKTTKHTLQPIGLGTPNAKTARVSSPRLNALNRTPGPFPHLPPPAHDPYSA